MASYFLSDMAIARRLGGREARGIINEYNKKAENFRRNTWNAHPLLRGRAIGTGINMGAFRAMMQARHQGMVDRNSPGPMGRRPAGSEPYLTHTPPGLEDDRNSRMMRDAERTIVHTLPGPVTGVRHVNPAAMGYGTPQFKMRQHMANIAARNYGNQQAMMPLMRQAWAQAWARNQFPQQPVPLNVNFPQANDQNNPWMQGPPVGAPRINIDPNPFVA
jgi:hypothetical protein